MERLFIPAREAQAIREVGATTMTRWTALSVVLLFVATIYAVSLFEPVAERLDGSIEEAGEGASTHLTLFSDFGARIEAGLNLFRTDGARAANRALLDAVHEFEDRLEEGSFLHRWLLPEMQWLLAAWAGIGNEQAYIGTEGWLFYRPDVDYVTGPGFLEPEVLRNRRRGGDLWRDPPQPDPVPALVDFDHQLKQRGIHLVVLPTPVKPTIHPERFAAGANPGGRTIQNTSFGEFSEQLALAGVDVLDPSADLAEVHAETGQAQFLHTDTHWTPQAVELVAELLAVRLEETVSLAESQPGRLRTRRVKLEGLGDVASMLLLPPDQTLIPPERVTVSMVLRSDGGLWRPDRGAEVILLGDSFSNIFSDSTLGWGSGAGLAEHLSLRLQRPVDKIALNAGGALGTRRALQRGGIGGEDRLARKKAVIYQFADRELSFGDWKLLSLE